MTKKSTEQQAYAILLKKITGRSYIRKSLIDDIISGVTVGVEELINKSHEIGICPNCGKRFNKCDLNNTSSIKTYWGGSVLFGVCNGCAEKHKINHIT